MNKKLKLEPVKSVKEANRTLSFGARFTILYTKIVSRSYIDAG
jgi:hypothetical protein